MTDIALQQLDTIRSRVGDLHSRADQVNHLAMTIRHHLVPEISEGLGSNPLHRSWFESVDVLLGLVADLGDQMNAGADAIDTAENELRRGCTLTVSSETLLTG